MRTSHVLLATATAVCFLSLASSAFADLAPIYPDAPAEAFVPSAVQIFMVAFFVMSALEMCVFFGLRSAPPAIRFGGVFLIGAVVMSIAAGVFFWSESQRSAQAERMEQWEAEKEEIRRENSAARSRNQDLRERMEMEQLQSGLDLSLAKDALVALVREQPDLLIGASDADQIAALPTESIGDQQYKMGPFTVDVKQRRYTAVLGEEPEVHEYSGRFQVERGNWTALPPDPTPEK